MEREVRYCTTEDGVCIAYSVQGRGYPLLLCPVFVESISLAEEVGAYRELLARLAKRWTLIRYDPRGVRLSQGASKEQSNDALVRDVEAVVAATGLKSLALWANTMSGPRAISYAAKRPDRISHLILYDTYANPTSFPEGTARAMAEMARTNWRLLVEMVADLDRALGGSGAGTPFPDLSAQLARLWEGSSEGEVGAEMFLQNYQTWDVRELLPTLKCKTLVMHHVSNYVFPIDEAKMLAAKIPRARMVAIDGPYSTPLEDILAGYDLISRIEQFLPVEEPIIDEPRWPVRTILFTDLVGHAEMMSRLGDERGRAVLREHERITRKVLRAHGGTEVKTMGDGFMASFGSVTKAVECAVALQRTIGQHNRDATAQHASERDHGRDGEDAATPDRNAGSARAAPLLVRCGLNAGEPIEEDGPDGRQDLFGATVILASRIAAKAEGGEILVADTVRGLCSGKGFSFSDRGEFVAKGYEEPVRVYEVIWRN